MKENTTTIIQTVLGPIPSAELGVTLPHEHFFCTSASSNLAEPADPRERELARQPASLAIRDWLEYNWDRNRDTMIMDDEATAIEEAERYRRAGGQSVVDLTNWGIGRNPLGLARISRKTGLHIVMGSGCYVEPTHPPEVAKLTESALADRIVAEFADGVDGTGIRPGVIGEIGCNWPLTAAEEKSLRASGMAQREVGAALYVHPGKHPDALPQIVNILESTGADLGRVILCHIERTDHDVSRIMKLMRRGCTIEYDLFSVESTSMYYRSLGIEMLSDAQRLTQIRELIDAGFLNQLLMSHDVSFKHRLHKYGGQGYDYILVNTLPWMRQRGFTETEIETITVHNPRRLVELKG